MGMKYRLAEMAGAQPGGFLERRRTRFAPSPTGHLHLGHVANALHVWGIARAYGGEVLLRLEDHDRCRCRPEYEVSILEDLEWLGLAPDVGPAAELRRSPSAHRQSDNCPRYEAALKRLAAMHQVYACDCSRKKIGVASDLADQEIRYTGRCRDRNLEAGPGRGIRLTIEGGAERFGDLLLGWQEQTPASQCGDVLVKDRLGNWTYQFAVVVDDLDDRIDLVIRGQDLLASTGRQIRMGRMLGRAEPPAFVHHPLIRHSSGQKLSKANRDTGVRDLRASGISAAAVLGEAAYLTGLAQSARDIHPGELASLFHD
jgi:glutamyl/glutaminyl-tRNA synthetase